MVGRLFLARYLGGVARVDQIQFIAGDTFMVLGFVAKPKPPEYSPDKSYEHKDDKGRVPTQSRYD